MGKKVKNRQPRRRPLLEEIEPRILYSADFAPGLVPDTTLVSDAEQRTVDLGGEFAATAQEAQARRHELVLVETDTPDYQKLVDDILKQAGDGRDIEVVLLDASKDGLQQITDILAARQDLSAVHLVSHGADGTVELGATELNFDTLLKNATQIKGWGKSLSAEADILIYGCDVAQQSDGKALIDALARLTGADVAASEDLTGASAQGGNWTLEYRTGGIYTPLAISTAEQFSYSGTLATYTVTNTNDTGAGSLRQAIQNANANGGADTIDFNIPGAGVKTINVMSALPAITGTVVIDGTTQPGFASTPLIEIDGQTQSYEGLYLDTGSDGSTIKGLAINHFMRAILINASSNNVVVGNFLGTDATGTVAKPNWAGVATRTSNNIIGGTSAADRNIISGNSVDGIQITGASGGSGNVVMGNYIGVDVTGTVDLGNTNQGVALYNGAKDNIIGGTAAGAGNVISGNNGEGVRVVTSGTTGNVVVGNLIGTNAAGTAGIANNRGVWIDDTAADNTVGGTAAGAGNVIAYNTLDGVALSSTAGSGNRVAGNAIFSNGGLGIDLSDNGVTANEAGDGDTGPNGLQNFPVLIGAYTDGGSTVAIAGSLNSTANITFRIEFFASASADVSGYGEGARYLGFVDVYTDASGNASFVESYAANAAVGEVVTATATNIAIGSTSEFSQARTTAGALIITTTNDVVDGTTSSVANLVANKGADGKISLREAIVATNNTVGLDAVFVPAGTYTLSIAGAAEDLAATGDLDIRDPLILAGAGASTTTINGGGIDRVFSLINSSSAYLTGVTISGGNVSGDAGGFYLNSGGQSAVLTHAVLSGNVAGGAGLGGAIRNVNGNLTMYDVRLTGNTASAGGGVYNNDTAFITNSLVDNNSAVANGGGIDTTGAGSALTLANVTISGNLAGNAGGGLLNGKVAVLQNVTIANNTANRGGGLGVGGGSTTTTVRNTIIAGNAQTGGGGPDVDGAVQSAGYNIVGNTLNSSGWVAADQQNVNPMLGVLASNGGFTMTHALQAGSPAINAGTSTGAPLVDQRDYLRDAQTDIGAFEYNGTGQVPLNTAPANSMPANQYTALNTNLTLSSGNGNPLSISDADAGTSSVQVTLTVTNGALTLASTAGLSFAVGDGSADATMTFTGTIAGINTALDGLVFAPTNGYRGPARLTLTTNDLGHTGAGGALSDTDTIDIDVGAIVVTTTSDAANGNVTSFSALLANDGGDGISLREAIQVTNAVAGLDHIYFDIAGAGVQVISPTSALPNITDAVIIDGTTEPGYAGTPVIVLDGAGAGAGIDGLMLAAGSSGSTIRSLAIHSFTNDGIGVRSSNNQVLDNHIGTDGAGLAALGNGGDGMDVRLGASGNLIRGNVIIANTSDGIVFDGAGTSNNLVQANRLGIDLGGGLDGNRWGVRIQNSATGIVIGGTNPGDGNIIAGNTRDGVTVAGGISFGNAVLGNSIYSNSNDGIDLNDDGVTANDGALTPGQSNLLMDFPVVQSAVLSGTTLTVSGYIGIAPNDTDFAGARVEFFKSPDAAGANGEGQVYLGFLTVDANGNFSGALTVSGLAVGDRVSATATDPSGNTSEFGLNYTVTPLNTAPVLADTAVTLNAVNEDVGAPAGAVGTLVSGLVTGVSDADSGALQGIAITAADTGNGSWWYSTDNGAIWSAMGAPDATSSRLLAADANTRIYFEPNANYNGTLATAITFRAWDQSSGANGGVADTSSNGGTTAFSSATDTASLTVNPVNDAPTITALADQTIPEEGSTAALTFIVGDIETAPGSLVVTATSSNTALIPNGNLLLGGGGANRTITVSPAANAYGGSVTITVSVFDGTSTTQETFDVSVTPLADTPAVTNAATNEDTQTAAGLVISRNAADGVEVSHFKITGIGGGTLYQNNGTTVINDGDFITFAQANAGLKFTPSANSTANGSFQVRASTAGNDAGLGGGVITATITINPVNDAPVVTAGATTGYTESGGGVVIDNTVTVSDADDTQITGATITISAGLTAGDVLGFTNTASITGSYNAGTGVLTLSGTDTVAAYQAALRSVTYSSTSEDPTALSASRALAWQVIDANAQGTGAQVSAVVTSTVNLTALPDAPVVAAGATTGYAENALAVVIDNTVTVGDADDTQIAVATVTIAAGLTTGDVLGFTNTASITGVYNAGTGVLTLTGADTLAAYHAALRSVTYRSTSEDPTAASASRTIAWQVTDANSDGTGAQPSTLVTSTVNLTALADAPVVTAGAVTAYTESAAAVAIDNTLTVGDADDTQLSGATVTIAAGLTAGDVLGFVNTGTITGSYNAGTGVLTLSGADTLAAYQAALRSVTYSSTSADPSAGGASRTIAWQVTDGDSDSLGAQTSVATTSTVNIGALNDDPVAVDNAAATDEDSVLNVAAPGVLADDSDIDGGALTVSAVDGNAAAVGNPVALASGALLTLNADGSYSYDPSGAFEYLGAGESDTDTFTYEVADGNGGFATATVTVTVNGINDAPTGVDAVVTIDEDASYIFVSSDFGFADADASDNLQGVRIVSLPLQGSLTLGGAAVSAGQLIAEVDIANGELVFTPAADANGAGYASFAFRVNDGTVDAVGANTVTIDVTGVNDAPDFTQAGNQSRNEDAGAQTVAAFAAGSAGGGADEAGQLLTYNVSNDNNALFAVQPTIDATGTLTYTLAADANGVANVTVWVSDNGGTTNGGVDSSASQAFTITANAVNDAPTLAIGPGQAGAEDAGVQSVAGFAAAAPGGGPDEGGQALSYVVSNDNNALFAVQPTLDAAGNLTYAAAPNAFGTATVTVFVADGGGTANGGVDASAAQTFTITVTPVNDAPVLGANTLTLNQSDSVVLAAANLSASDVDDSAAGLSFSVINISNGRFEYVSTPGVAITTFSQADIAGGLVRFVHDGSGNAPAYQVSVSDGALSDGQLAASIIFNPAPLVVFPPPLPVPVPNELPPEPPAPAQEEAPAEQPEGGALVRAVFSPGRIEAEAPEAQFNRLEGGGAPARRYQLVATLNTFVAGPHIDPTLQLLAAAPANLGYLPTVPVDWNVRPAFPDAEEAPRDRIDVLLEQVQVGGMALSVGVVWWASRISGLLGSLLASVPAWRHIDPLPVVGRDEDEEKRWYDTEDRDADANELAIANVLEGAHAAGDEQRA